MWAGSLPPKAATGTLVAYQIGPGAAQTSGAHGFMTVDHDMVLGGLFHHILVVVVHQLAIMVFATRNHVAHISRLHGVIAIFVHQFECLVDVPLVVECRR